MAPGCMACSKAQDVSLAQAGNAQHHYDSSLANLDDLSEDNSELLFGSLELDQ